MKKLSAAAETKALKFAENVARKVGDRIAQKASKRKSISFKGEVDLVTQFDHAAQRLILKDLRLGYPDFGILSEEDVDEQTDQPFKWIVDPLDGTTNFAHGLPIWAISIALEVRGRIALGVVYDPNRGEMFSGLRGRGARLNGRRIHVSKTRRLDHSLLVTNFKKCIIIDHNGIEF